MSVSDGAIENYLKGEPTSAETKQKRKFTHVWFGASEFKNKDRVKEICRGDGQASAASWCPVRKQQGTHQLKNVPRLILSGLWVPSGISAGFARLVATRAQQLVDTAAEADVAAQQARDSDEAKQTLKRNLENEEKQRLIRERESGDRAFSDRDFAEADAKWGFTRDALVATRSMHFLGPGTPFRPLMRVERWFSIQCRVCNLSVQEVIARDFAPALARMDAANDANSQSAQVKSRKRLAASSASTSGEDVLARVAREEDERKRQKEWLDEHRRTDPHRLALEKIIAASDAAPPIRAAVLRSCPRCRVTVEEQFLSCACMDQPGEWRRCEACMALWHPTKMACLC